MKEKSFDIIKLVRWILGVVVIFIPLILLRGLFFGTADGYPEVELNDIWSIVLLFIAGVLVLPIEFNLGKRQITGVVRVLLILFLLFIGVMII